MISFPFFREGDCHLFYIKEYGAETGSGPGRPWFHLVTRDFVNFKDWGEAVTHGAPDEQDVDVGAGSVIAGDGSRRYLFGWLPTRAGKTDDCEWLWGSRTAR